ncbi:MAG: pentapeptide repeat-containing protein [Anaerolineales bacterium]
MKLDGDWETNFACTFSFPKGRAKMEEQRSFRERLQRSWQYIKGRTGFFAYTDAEGKVQQGKMLWDWMQLLVIPAMLAVVSLWFSYSNRQSDMAIAEQRLQEEKLNAYLAKMEGYILDRELLSAKDQENPAIVQVAQVQTVTALRSMDRERRDLVFQFLHDSELIYFVLTNASLADIDLSGADLSGADLRGATLHQANLSNADLSNTDLRKAGLGGTNLRKADLANADLREAFLWEADLSGAELSGADLSEAYLVGANLTRTWPAGAYWRGATYDDSTKWPADFGQNFDPDVATKRQE